MDVESLETERNPFVYLQVVVRLFVGLLTRFSAGYRMTLDEKKKIIDFLRLLCSDFFSRYIPNESIESGDSVSRRRLHAQRIRNDGDCV